jgi:hypothetical protein
MVWQARQGAAWRVAEWRGMARLGTARENGGSDVAVF